MDIYTNKPINKTAAIVVSQSGCTTELTDEQKRCNLVAQWKTMHEKIKMLPKKSDERKFLNKKLREIQHKITKIRPARKGHHSLQHYIVLIIKERFTKNQWNQLMEQAIKRQKAGEKNAFEVLKTKPNSRRAQSVREPD